MLDLFSLEKITKALVKCSFSYINVRLEVALASRDPSKQPACDKYENQSGCSEREVDSRCIVVEERRTMCLQKSSAVSNVESKRKKLFVPATMCLREALQSL